MTDNDIILFAVKFLSTDNEYNYYYIYNDDEVIGEIYSFKQFNGFFFNIYIEEKYRNEENMLKALEAYKLCAFGFPNETRQIGLDIEDKFFGSIGKFLSFDIFILYWSISRYVKWKKHYSIRVW